MREQNTVDLGPRALTALLVLALCAPLAGCLTGKKRPTDGGVGDGGCAVCTPGQGDCVQDYIRFCIKAPDGCTTWTAPQPCPPETPFCSNGRCEAQCDDECSQDGQMRCMEQGHQICGQHDSDQCRDWGPVLACGEEELCWPPTGECLPDCGGQPCACKVGETQPCANVGTCRGGERSCVDGFFSPCVWDVPPRAEVCDGQDNDCDNKIDNNLIAEGCAQQAGVCKDALKRCGGSAGWKDCTDADYAAHATSKGLTYEPTEAACDGEDNDCDGDKDEPPDCCQPDCTGKACGDDDGCGHKCTEGSCPTGQICDAVEATCVCRPDCTGKNCGDDDGCGTACSGPCPGENESCQASQCACDYVACDTSCCAPKEVCKDALCCLPDCGVRVCGIEPKCGSSCGACSADEVCSGAGTCMIWSVAATGGADLYGIAGAAGATPDVWAVGGGGTVLHNSGGWQTVAGAPAGDYRGVWTQDGGVIAVATDGLVATFDGSNWGSDSPTAVGLRGVRAFADVILAVGAAGTVLRRDAVAPWEAQALPADVTGNLNGLWGTAESDLWVVGDADRVVRYDGSWTASTTGAGKPLRAIWGHSATHAWIVGDGGTILQRDAAAGKWIAVGNGPTTANLLAVHGSSPADVWAVGAQGTILHFDGAAWVKVTSPSTATLRGVWAASSTTAWIVGDGGAVLELKVPPPTTP